jgi:hypothetical protein
MISDARLRGSFGFCLRRHRGRILAGKFDFREVGLPRQAPLVHAPNELAHIPRGRRG